MGWVRFEVGRPTLGGALGGMMFGAAVAPWPALILGFPVFVAGLAVGAAVGAFTLRPARDLHR